MSEEIKRIIKRLKECETKHKGYILHEEVEKILSEELANHRQEKSKGVMKNSPATNNYEDTHKELANHSPKSFEKEIKEDNKRINEIYDKLEDTQKGCGKELGNCKCGEPCSICNGIIHLCPKCSGDGE